MFEQITLPYSYDGLEPAIDALTVETHYTKHHATYTMKLNEIGMKDQPIENILSDWKHTYADTAQGEALRNNGGGFYNHNLYFAQLSSNGGGEPAGELGQQINAYFGSFGAFKKNISDAAINQFGSGYAWLATDTAGNLSISQSPNQDNPLLETAGKLCPIFCIDIWEHAYYLKYKNVRFDYVQNFFDIVNWEQVTENYQKAKDR